MGIDSVNREVTGRSLVKSNNCRELRITQKTSVTTITRTTLLKTFGRQEFCSLLLPPLPPPPPSRSPPLLLLLLLEETLRRASREWGTGKQCVVCFRGYSYGEDLCQLPCYHMYHASVSILQHKTPSLLLYCTYKVSYGSINVFRKNIKSCIN